MQKDFLNKNIFKANDIRGIFPSEINERVVFEIALGVKNIFFTKGESASGGKCLIAVGRDARLSSSQLYEAVLSALKHEKKIKIIEAGLVTTPAFYFLVNKYRADGGIMVTASHNPKQYNGLKIVGKGAVPISGTEIFELVSASPAFLSAPTSPTSSGSERLRLAPKFLLRKNQAFRSSEVAVRNAGKSSIILYTNFLKNFVKPKRKLKVVFDCSNGVAGLVLKELLRKSNVKGQMSNVSAIFINEKPDGNFPAHSPNPLVSGSLDQIKKEVLKQKADLGVIFDGDGDRVFFIDNLGREIDPDIIGSILMKNYKPPFVVSTISSWRVKKVRGAVVARVGHLFMKEMMRKKKASLGMERSGHYYFKKFFYCDSGALATLEIINFVSKLKNTFSEYIDILPKYYQTQEANFDLSSGGKTKKNLEKKIIKIENFYKSLAKKINKKDGLLVGAGDWWFSLRFSNSENLFRLNIEANDKKTLNKRQKELRTLILG